jgi:hypothetical protein
LTLLLPKFLGILWETGKADLKSGYGKVTAFIDSDIELGGYVLDRSRFAIHAYLLTKPMVWTKVFSAHLGDRSAVDPHYFPYWNGRCGILIWKRGTWEDRVEAQGVAPRTIAHLTTAGLTRTK